MNFNKIILMGNLTRDPEKAYLPSQDAVTKFGIAVNKTWTKDGQKQERVMFVDCKIFGKQAETFAQYMSKGKPVLVEGELELETWEKDGQKRSKHVVRVFSFRFLGKPDEQQKPAPQAAPRQDDPGDLPYGEETPF